MFAFDARPLNLYPRTTSTLRFHSANLINSVLAEFSNPVWKFDYTFSKRYPSKNNLINANRIDELSQKLISQTDAQYWNGYFMGTTANYFPSHYDRFGLYCIVRYVLEDDFHRCYDNFKVHN